MISAHLQSKFGFFAKTSEHHIAQDTDTCVREKNDSTVGKDPLHQEQFRRAPNHLQEPPGKEAEPKSNLTDVTHFHSATSLSPGKGSQQAEKK